MSDTHMNSEFDGAAMIDARARVDIGMMLARIREARSLTPDGVADALSLPTMRVDALETGDVSAFPGPAAYRQALSQYAVLLGLDPSIVQTVHTPSASKHRRRWFGRAAAVMAMLLLLVAIAASTGRIPWLRPPWSSQPAPVSSAAPANAEPDTPTHIPTIVFTPEPSTPADAGRTPALRASADSDVPSTATAAEPSTVDVGIFGTVRVPRSTWIVVREDDTFVGRTVVPGTPFALNSQPTYLAVGAADAELTIGGQRVDLSPFVVNGEVRLRARDLASLARQAPAAPSPSH